MFALREAARRQSVAKLFLPRLALFVAWILIVVWLASRHVLWRDEVRALSFALASDNWIGMLRHLHGEGHPALWYILLRAAHDLVGVPQVLPAMSLAVAALTAGLLVFRSPFPWLLVALILAGHAFVYEYSVMARNYGLGALLIFALAAFFRERRDHGVGLGILLALAANTNAIAAAIAVAFLAYWLLEIVEESGLSWTMKHRRFAINAAIATLGLLVAFATMYPTFNDAAFILNSEGPATGALDLGSPFAKLLGYDVWPSHLTLFGPRAVVLFGPILLLAATLGLMGRPPAFLAALLSLVGLALFFNLGVKGDYRHEMTWLAFLIALYWINWPRLREARGQVRRWVSGAGFAAFVVLLTLQATLGAADIVVVGIKGAPESRSEDFARLLSSRPDLKDSILIADPDYMLEPLRYWVDNPFYFVREKRFGDTVRFSRKARSDLSISDLLAAARSLRAATGRPIVIALALRLDSLGEDRRFRESYAWTISARTEEVAAFNAACNRIASFGSVSSDETYDVYTLK